MNKEYFYLSEIILGLREEYINTMKQLDELKSMMIVDANCDVRLGIYSPDSKTNMLVIKLEEKLRGLKKLINSIEKKYKNNTMKTEVSCDTGFVRNYVQVNEPSKYRVEDLNTFYGKCDQVLHTQFNKSVFDKYFDVENQNMKVKIGHNGVFCVTNNDNRYAPNTGFDYYAGDDQLILNNYYGNPEFAAGIFEVMNTPIFVSPNIAQIINANDKSKLKLQFEGLTSTKDEQRFELVEEPGRVLAKRVK